MSVFELYEKTVLITGAGRGIGRQTAVELASLGATIFATDIDLDAANDTVATVKALGCHAQAIRHDVTSEGDWRSVVEFIGANGGRLDVLVNNAGVILNKPFAMTSYEDYRRVMAINVDSIFIGCQAVRALMTTTAKDTRGASIINLSSIYGQIAGPMQSAYCASKGAVRMLTKALAVEFARLGTGIRVNSVHPGPVNTELGRSGVRDAVALGALPNENDGMQRVAQQFPMGRWGEIDDVSSVIAFLASDASKFMTASELTVDGGYTAI